MPIVTSIKPQKSKKRVNIYLDGKFAFGLDLQTYLKENLKVEQELTEEKIAEIVKKGEFQTTYDKILRFASLRPRSRKEYQDWMNKYKVHESIRNDIFEKLERLEFLDDEKFAKWWVEQRNNFKPKPKRILISELRIKGINQEIIDKILDEESVDERKIAENLVAKKERLWKGITGFEKKRKTYTFLLQKGFDTEVIRSVVGEINED